MIRKEFIVTVLASSIFSAAIVYVALSWPSPPEASAVTKPPAYSTVRSAFQSSVSSDEETNIRIYSDLSQSVVNVTSTRLRYNFWMRVVPEQGSGSGFLIDRDGHILTNNHVQHFTDIIQIVF